jgi:predicted aspartyl protease
MFLIGVIADMGVFILVDTGAMHNIIDINVARAIGLREQRVDTTILIGSGTKSLAERPPLALHYVSTTRSPPSML